MNVITRKFMAFIKEEEGLTTVEYAIAGSLVAAGVVVAFDTLGCEVDYVIDYLAQVVGWDSSGGGAAPVRGTSGC